MEDKDEPYLFSLFIHFHVRYTFNTEEDVPRTAPSKLTFH